MSKKVEFLKLAHKALQDLPLTEEECLAVLRCPDEEILELLQATFIVRKKYFGKKVYLHMLINAKSGLCTEDCSYCSQSAVSRASIEKYPLVDAETIIMGAKDALRAKAKRYCIVSSGHSPHEKDLRVICEAVRGIKKEVGIEICTSLGILNEDTALALKEAGVDRYNHNINTSERFYSSICSTHTFEDRIQTLRHARGAGMELCCGALFGLDESDKDIIDTSLALKEISPDSIPINFLNPIPGTPLENSNQLTPLNCLAILCLVRFLNPRTEIRVAGGREHNLRSVQSLALYPANSLFVSGYLTTSGQTPEQAQEMIKDMGFEVELERSMEIASEM